MGADRQKGCILCAKTLEITVMRSFSLLIVLVFGASLVCAQQTPVPVDQPKKAVYDELLSKLTAGETKIDYRALRIAYPGSKDASPYGSSHEARRAMNAAVIEKRCADAIRMADDILKTTYLSPDAHVAESMCYAAQGDMQKAEFHKAVYLGLINSILAGGDGARPETAYVVVTVEEEYAVMKALGFTVWAQATGRQGEHVFDVLSATNEKTKQTTKFYFNLDYAAALLRQPRPQP